MMKKNFKSSSFDTLELAENKLLILYILNKIKIPIYTTQITEIILESNYLDYFALHQYLSELHNSKFIKYLEKDNKSTLTITESGSTVLSLFKERIPEYKVAYIDLYLEQMSNIIKKQLNVTSDYTIENNNAFIVSLKAEEGDIILIDMKINVPTKQQAIDLCDKWKKDPSNLYKNLMNLLLG